MTRRTVVAALVAGVAGGLVLGAPVAAQASCAEDSGPAGSPVVFVGTVEAERAGYTRLAVEEVRRGPDLAPEVWVRTGQEQPPWPLSLVSAVGSSVDAELEPGTRWVVGASRGFDTSACSVAEARGTAEDGARGPVADGLEGADPPLPVWVPTAGAAGVVVVGVVGLVTWRRRRRATTS
jgi:hypothetical protein